MTNRFPPDPRIDEFIDGLPAWQQECQS